MPVVDGLEDQTAQWVPFLTIFIVAAIAFYVYVRNFMHVHAWILNRLSHEQWMLTVALGGVFLAIMAGVSLNAWMTAGWFNDGQALPAGWVGYDVDQFVGLFFFLVLTPLAFTLLFTSFQHMMKKFLSSDNTFFLSVYVVLGMSGLATISAFAIWGASWCNDILQNCVFGDGCINSATHTYSASTDPVVPEAGQGWKASVGIFLLCTCFLTAVAVFGGLVRNLFVVVFPYFGCKTPSCGCCRCLQSDKDELKLHLLNRRDSDPYSKAEGVPESRIQPFKENLWFDWSIFFFIVVPFVLVLFFIDGYLPNTFEYVTPYRISTWVAGMQATRNETMCGVFPTYSCPEYDFATFHTVNVKMNDYWYLKLFPDNVFFCLFLLVVSFMGLLIKSVPLLKETCAKKVKYSQFSFFSVAEISLLFAIFALLFLVSYYWLHDHNYNGYWPFAPNFVFHDSERVYRASGQVAVMLMSLLMFPAARSYLTTALFGSSWEIGLQFHRWLGVAFLALVFIHMVAVWVWQYQNGNFVIFAVPLQTVTTLDNFTVPLQTVVAWIIFLAVGVLAGLEGIRRAHFEIFLYAHHIAYCILIPSVLWHAAASWEYLTPGLTVWFIDRCVRAYRSSKSIKIVDVSASVFGGAGGVTTLTVEAPFQYYPGHYAFLNVSELSLFQWHPFTIASDGSNEMTFHIKNMGPDTWTGRLYQLASAIQTKKTDMLNNAATRNAPLSSIISGLTLSIDGPTGAPIDFTQYSNVILVAGGIGVTPCKSIFESLRRCTPSQLGPNLRKVHLLWAARDEALFRGLMSDSLKDLPSSVFSARLFIDNPDAAQSGGFPKKKLEYDADGIEEQIDLRSLTQYRRPNFDIDLKNVVDRNVQPDKVLLFVCGPPGITAACEALADNEGWSFHTELFAL